MSLEKEIINVVNAVADKKTKGYDTPAQVVRVEGSTVWVHIPGGVDETPVQRTVNCVVGDMVQVRVSGGRAWITGNASSPPTDDKLASLANSTAAVSLKKAVKASDKAEMAEETANVAFANAYEVSVQINGTPLYWNIQPHTTIAENDHPVLVAGIQLHEDGDPLYWDEDYYSHWDVDGQPDPSYEVIDTTTQKTSYPILDNDDPVFTVNLVNELSQKADESSVIDIENQINGVPLYWSEEPFFTTSENNYPVKVNENQVYDSSNEPLPLYWDTTHYSAFDEEGLPTSISITEEQTLHPIVSNGEQVLSVNIISELENKTSVEDFNTAKSEIDQNITNLRSDVDKNSEALYILQGKVRVTDSVIIGDPDGYNVNITDQAVNIRYKDTPKAWITQEELHAPTANITFLRLAEHWLLEVMDDGSLILKER